MRGVAVELVAFRAGKAQSPFFCGYPTSCPRRSSILSLFANVTLDGSSSVDGSSRPSDFRVCFDHRNLDSCLVMDDGLWFHPDLHGPMKAKFAAATLRDCGLKGLPLKIPCIVIDDRSHGTDAVASFLQTGRHFPWRRHRSSAPSRTLKDNDQTELPISLLGIRCPSTPNWRPLDSWTGSSLFRLLPHRKHCFAVVQWSIICPTVSHTARPIFIPYPL